MRAEVTFIMHKLFFSFIGLILRTKRNYRLKGIRRFTPLFFGIYLSVFFFLSGCEGVISVVPVGDGGGDSVVSASDANVNDNAEASVDGGSGETDANLDAGVGFDAEPALDSGTQVDSSTQEVVPPLGGSSGGSGGGVYPSGETVNASGVSIVLIVPSSYNHSQPNRLMIVYSGTEGDVQMAENLRNVAPMAGLEDVIFAVLDGVAYNGDGAAGATVLDYLRSNYNISNDETFLLSESAGTTAGLLLGLDLRQSYFAAYWANDVNASASPKLDASELGFAPWGNSGPGGNFTAADAIVDGMSLAGYRLPADAPYSGAGSSVHGSPEQFIEALQFFDGKSRQ